jgi:hypothetical protein
MAAALLLLLLLPVACSAYSVLTHEAVVDALWLHTIVPLVRGRFPDVTDEQLREAHAHAYGGAIIQDLGYYPLGNKLFSDLTHYVRSGDFVEALLKRAQTPQEYGFALGAMAHHFSDSNGHPIGTNPAVALVYPKLGRKYGREVTYAESPSAHLKTEFGFDVLEVAKGRYAPEAYHDFIGFELSKRLLEEAFEQTYSMPLSDVFANVDLAMGTFRFSVSTLIPTVTKVAWEQKRDDIEKTEPGITRHKFLFNLSRASYETEWGGKYERPGWFAKFLAWILRIMPKFGPFSALGYRMPTAEAEKLFMDSFNATLARYRAAAPNKQPDLQNFNLDTGRPVSAGQYKIADRAYRHYLEKIGKHETAISSETRADILRFYGERGRPDSRKARRVLSRLRPTAGR